MEDDSNDESATLYRSDINATVYTEEGEMLTEVELADDDDAPPDDDDNESIWSDVDSEVIQNDPNNSVEVDDMSLHVFRAHTDSVYCAAIHPLRKGLVLTGGGDDRAFLWNFINPEDTNEQLVNEKSKQIELSGHTDTVSSVGFNYDGTLALTGSYDGTIRVWSVETGECKITLEGPEDIEFAEWHSKGNAILAGSRDGTAWMWLAHNGQCVQVFAGHDGGITCGGFTGDGGSVFTGGEDGTVRLWAPKTGKCRHVFEGHFGHEGVVTCCVSSANGEMLLSGSIDGTVKLYQVAKKKMLQTFTHSRATEVDVNSHAVGDTPIPSSIVVESVTEKMDDDEDEAIEGMESSFGEFEKIDESPEVNQDEEGEMGVMSIECVGFCPSLPWVASGGMDKTLKVWDTVSGTCRCVCSHGGSVVVLRWHPSLPVVTTAALDNFVRLWDARGGTLLIQLSGHSDIITNMTSKSISMQPTQSDAVSLTANSDSKPSNLVSSNIDLIITVSDDRTARVFQVDPYLLLN